MPIHGQVGRAGIGAQTTAILMGTGDSTTPYSDSNADKNFIGYWLTSSATSGTTRGTYQRLYLTGGAGGEAARFFTTVSSNTPADTCNGAHISLSFGSSAGNITGEGHAVRGTLHVPNRALTGTTSAIQAELSADGTSSSLNGTHSFIRCALTGNATGAAAIEDNVNLIEISGGSVASGNMVVERSAATNPTHMIRCNIYGTTYYLYAGTSL